MITAKSIEFFYLLFEGIMLFQVVFFGMVYLISRRRDVLYYSLLNLVSAAYFFLNAPDTFLGIDENIIFDSPVYLYSNFALFLSMMLLYLIFLKEVFSDTVEKFEYVKKIYLITFYSLPILYLLFVLCGMAGISTQALFYSAHLINGPFCTLILLLNIREQGYKKLIIYGMVIVFICVLITIAFTVRYNSGSSFTIFDKYPLVAIKLGMLIDIILFQVALLKRWNEQEKQLAVEKIQSQLGLERLRNKISGELHDDIGSTLSGISMYSHMTNEQLQNGNYEKVKNSIGIIQRSASEIVGKLSDLVWAINPQQDSFTTLMEKIVAYADDMCKAKGISFTTNFSLATEKQDMPMESRLQVYLILKEAVNNAVKYSNARHIDLQIKKQADHISVEVKDDGIGFDTGSKYAGNGLVNMAKRSEEIGGKLLLLSERNNGTTVRLFVRITQ